MKHKILFTAILLAAACVSCGTQPQNKELPQKTPVQAEENLPNEETNDSNIDADLAEKEELKNPANGDELFAISTLTGTVTEFSENGCTLTPTYSDENVASEAAPGYENQMELISIIYNEDCVFRIAYVNIQSGTVSYETASAADVKKQTRLVICGEYDNENVLHASRIFIYRKMG